MLTCTHTWRKRCTQGCLSLGAQCNAVSSQERPKSRAPHDQTSIDLRFCSVFWFMWILLCVLVYVDLRKKKYSSAWLLLVQHIVCCVIVCVGSWALSLSSFSPVSLSSFSLSLSILDTRGVGRGLQSFLINAWLWFQGDGVLTWHAYCLGICNQGLFWFGRV